MVTAQSYQLHPLCRCRGTSPKGGSEGCATHHPQRGQQGPRLPGGGAVEQSETEGVLFVEWHQLKNTNYTPFAAAAALPPKGAARETRLPNGGAVEQSETEGVWFVGW